MIKPKSLAVPAGAGFVLSFLISLCSTHKLGVSFLRAWIFAAVFAALGFALDFVYGSFLDGGSKGSDFSDEPARKAASKSSGSVVDITIDDESLTEDENAPAFDVSHNKGAGTISSVSAMGPERRDSFQSAASQASDDEPDAANDGAPVFKPVQLGVPLEEAPAVESEPVSSPVIPAESAGGGKAAERMAARQEIDALPDIGGFGDDSSSGNSSVISDSEFAQSGIDEAPVQVTGSSGSGTSSSSGNQDTAVIASAIRTLLKRDE